MNWPAVAVGVGALLTAACFIAWQISRLARGLQGSTTAFLEAEDARHAKRAKALERRVARLHAAIATVSKTEPVYDQVRDAYAVPSAAYNALIAAALEPASDIDDD